MTPEEREIAKAASVRETQERTNHWLKQMGFWKTGQTRAGLMQDLAAFRKESCPKPAGRDWARIMKSRIADGKQLPVICREICEEALRLPAREDEE